MPEICAVMKDEFHVVRNRIAAEGERAAVFSQRRRRIKMRGSRERAAESEAVGNDHGGV